MGAGRADTGTAHRGGPRTSECQQVSLAGPLSWAVSDADRGMTARATPAQRQVRTSRVSTDGRHARPCPGLKDQQGADFCPGWITAMTGSVQACLAAGLAIRHRQDHCATADGVWDGPGAMSGATRRPAQVLLPRGRVVASARVFAPDEVARPQASRRRPFRRSPSRTLRIPDPELVERHRVRVPVVGRRRLLHTSSRADLCELGLRQCCRMCVARAGKGQRNRVSGRELRRRDGRARMSMAGVGADRPGLVGGRRGWGCGRTVISTAGARRQLLLPVSDNYFCRRRVGE